MTNVVFKHCFAVLLYEYATPVFFILKVKAEQYPLVSLSCLAETPSNMIPGQLDGGSEPVGQLCQLGLCM